MSTQDPPSLRVWVVDDDPVHTTIVTRTIRSTDQQAEIQTAQDGEAALEMLHTASRSPDLILLDINMPGLSGLELLAVLKRDSRLKRIPVVMLTSSELTDDIARAYELGASGYISKPTRAHDLRAALGNTLLYWSAMKRVVAGGGV